MQVSNLFIMSLAAADLTVGVIVMPISAAYAMMGKAVKGGMRVRGRGILTRWESLRKEKSESIVVERRK